MSGTENPPAHTAPRGWRMPDWVEPVLIVTILLTSMFLTRRPNYSILKPRGNEGEYEQLPHDVPDQTSSDGDSSSGRGSSRSSSEHADERADRIQRSQQRHDDAEPYPSKLRTVFGCFQVRTPNSSRFARYPHSRILQKFPFLIEMFYWAVTFFFYRMTAGLSRQYYGGIKSLWDVGMNHGLTILELEARTLGSWETPNDPNRWLEWRVQHWFLTGADKGDWRGIFLTVLNRGYALIHIPGTVGFIAYYYATAPTHRRFCTVRRTMSLLNLWAFVIFVFYPCTPPRLLPAEYGFVDTVNLEDAQSVWMSGDYVNKLAAMPSMHFGYAFCIGMVFIADSYVLTALFPKRLRRGVFGACFGRFGRWGNRVNEWWRRDDGFGKDELSEEEAILRSRSALRRAAMFAFGVWYPAWILLTIVATANHYLLDAIVAAFGVLLCYLCNRILLNLLPIEDLLLWVLRLEKPIPTTGRKRNVSLR